MTDTTTAHPDVVEWGSLADQTWPVLLCGNGLSRELWPDFGYGSLRGQGGVDDMGDLFDALKTSNFEDVLEVLEKAALAARHTDSQPEPFEELADRVRAALFDAVITVHPRKGQLDTGALEALGSDLVTYAQVFTTSYDLCIYWSLMSSPALRDQSTDCFGIGGRLDTAMGEGLRRNGRTGIYYLHGAAHLWREEESGAEGKWVGNEGGAGGPLLQQLARSLEEKPERKANFVSEGSSESKSFFIRRSTYLSHCLSQLKQAHGSMVVFGQAFGPQDQHLAEAVRLGSAERVAVSVYRGERSDAAETIDDFLARIRYVLRGKEITFFWSDTHPLGQL